MELEEMRRSLDRCILDSVQSIAKMKERDVKGYLLESYYDQVRGMLSAAMFMDVISMDEYDNLCDEVLRWEYCLV